MFAKLLTEFIGTFIFLYVIIAVGEPVAVGVTLTAVAFFSGKISGGHVNPVVSFAKMMKGEMSALEMSLYSLVHIAGAACAVLFHNMNTKPALSMPTTTATTRT